MYAFFSGKPDNKSKITPKPLIGLNFLRISENDYFDFLRLWVDWLEKIGFRA